MPLVFGGPGKALPKTLGKREKRRKLAEFRVTFLWPNKEKSLGCRADKSAGLPICMRSTRRAKGMDVFREPDLKQNPSR